jgi:S-adenosylmethionine:tRNA ribosyltransferase-isomerase
LLVLDHKTGALQDSRYAQLADFLRKGDVLVINNTRVIPARLLATTETGAERELLLLEKHGQEAGSNSSMVMYRRSVRVGQRLHVGQATITIDELFGNGTARISASLPLWQLAEQSGSVPLPPYMHRNEEPGDRERYQTVFAKEKGSVAAPTASLNLTEGILASIRDKGVEIVELTLHVGLGTFMPIRTEEVSEHTMHQEYFEIPKTTVAAIQKAKHEERRVIAVGTTVTRTLEYANEALLKEPTAIHGEADIFIYPGYRFKIVDGMVTNFHAPHSTVLMMAAAFAGWDHLKDAYQHALREGYAFLSYGDSMLLL